VRKHLGRPSPALVIAVVALIAATSGNAIADGVTAVAAKLGKNSVTSREVKNGSLTLADFKAKERDKLKGAAGAAGAKGATGPAGPTGPKGDTGPQGPAGTPDGYTKGEADGRFLGTGAKAADAEKLDGIDSTGFIQGSGGTSYNFGFLADDATSGTFLTLPDIGHISVTCTGATESMSFKVFNDSGQTIDQNYSVTRNATASIVGGGQIADGASFDTNLGTTDSQAVLQLSRRSGLLVSSNDVVTVVLSAVSNPAGHTDRCGFQGHVLSGEGSSNLILLP
jgi:hypothetical protein